MTGPVASTCRFGPPLRQNTAPFKRRNSLENQEFCNNRNCGRSTRNSTGWRQPFPRAAPAPTRSGSLWLTLALAVRLGEGVGPGLQERPDGLGGGCVIDTRWFEGRRPSDNRSAVAGRLDPECRRVVAHRQRGLD